MDIQKFFTPATTLLKSNNEIINLFLISFTALLFLPINYFTSNNPVEVFKRFVVRQLSSPLVMAVFVYIIYASFLVDQRMFILLLFMVHTLSIHSKDKEVQGVIQ